MARVNEIWCDIFAVFNQPNLFRVSASKGKWKKTFAQFSYWPMANLWFQTIFHLLPNTILMKLLRKTKVKFCCYTQICCLSESLENWWFHRWFACSRKIMCSYFRSTLKGNCQKFHPFILSHHRFQFQHTINRVWNRFSVDFMMRKFTMSPHTFRTFSWILFKFHFCIEVHSQTGSSYGK